MGTASHGVIMDYDTTKPGRNFPDEAKRATADLARLAARWITIAEVNEELLNPSIVIEYDDETGEELPIKWPPVNIRPNSRREDFEREVSEFWPVWIKAWQRAQDALKTITYPEIMGPLLAARQAMVELGKTFNPQVSPSPDHRLGHHLSRPGGVLYCRAGGRCRVRRAQIEEIVQPLNHFSDLVGTYDTGPTPPCAPEDQEAGSVAFGGEAVPVDPADAHKDLSAYRTGEWFAAATGRVLTSDRLRQAVNRRKLVESFKRDSFKHTEWLHKVLEVSNRYPQCASAISKRMAKEGS